MELQTISQISKTYHVSTRTLRYYEQIGLISSGKKDGYAYRVYSEETVKRLYWILVLRKLRIPLKQIAEILQREDTQQALELFLQQISSVDEEITALSTIRSILQTLAEKLNGNLSTAFQLERLADEELLKVTDALTMTKINFEEKKTMDSLKKASEQISRLTDRDVRIINLPPFTVAAYRSLGSMAEVDSMGPVREWVERVRLFERYPQARHFGFNHPNGKEPDQSDHGYERWITVPDDFEVEPPFMKKSFPGGLYAAHMIPMGAFEEWQWLLEWALNSDRYEPAMLQDHGECMQGLLEEHLNFRNVYSLPADSIDFQIDLLLPVRARKDL